MKNLTISSQTISKPVQQALDYLLQNLAKKVWVVGDRLPSQIKLAEEAQVSLVSINKAIALLKKQGMLWSKTKSGTFVGNQGPVQSQKKPFEQKWKTIKEQVKVDVLEGNLHNREILPSLKELCSMYGTGFKTMHKVLHALIDEEILTIINKKYKIKIESITSTRINTLYFFVSSQVSSNSLWSHDRAWFEAFSQTIDKECIKRNIQLVRCSFLTEEQLSKIVHKDQTLGFLFWNSQDVAQSISSLALFLSRYKKPIAIINTIYHINKHHIQELKTSTKNYPDILITNVDCDRMAGFKMGRFLYAKGHTKVCFFGNSRTTEWTVDRYQGVCEAFTTLGKPNAVVPFFVDELPGITILSESDKKAIAGIDKELQTFQHQIETNDALKTSHPGFLLKTRTHIYEYLNAIFLEKTYLPLFRQASKLRDSTAWVCSEDNCAIYAARPFLAQEDLKSRIGIVGFNDQIESSFYSLSTYHFDYVRAALAMINFVVYKDNRATRKKLLEIDGMVIDRGSV